MSEFKIDWDKWREEYDSTPYTVQLDFYDFAYQHHPEQMCHSEPRAREFFDFVTSLAPGQSFSVVEVGGWRGELASELLPSYPQITRWTNYEICRSAVRDSVLREGIYSAHVPQEWLWEGDLTFDADVFIGCHVIEHMKFAQLDALMDRVKARWVYFEAPLLRPGWTWEGYEGTHINEASWSEVKEMMDGKGYELWRFVSSPAYREEVGCATWERR